MLIINVNLFQLKALFFQQPELINIAKFKPVYLNPVDSICGINYQETLQDNLLFNSTINCDQICPFGKSFQNLNKLEQLNLYLMQPCDIKKDYEFILNSKSNSLNSYFFDISNNINKCINDGTQIDWKPFLFNENEKSFFSSINQIKSNENGFSFTLWFQQFINNFG